jgi:hypothetical protein
VFSVALAEINRKIINQRLILWYLSSNSVGCHFLQDCISRSSGSRGLWGAPDCVNEGLWLLSLFPSLLPRFGSKAVR